ncbi:MAG: glycosyl hydrolase family 32 [Verrucomicrobia bacterium]|nr:glycosyl hydrolase family 32 [Verrucomicrobiota bacterium]
MKSLARVTIPLLAVSAWAAGGEVLYNGIELPAVWPPRVSVAELKTFEPMRLPYLERPPAVIPIDVGRQLFVDDFLVEQTTLTRRFHKAEPHPGNPVLRPDKRWEKFATPPASAIAFSDGCFFDPADKLFKIWYRPSHGSGTCYATSTDGIHWKKPPLDVQPGSNVVLLGGQRDSSTIWLDHDAKDAAQRFKFFQFQRDSWRASVHTSPDGIHWSAPIWCGPAGDRSTMFYNPFRKVWVFSIRAFLNKGPGKYTTKPFHQYHRARKYGEAGDFLAGSQWSGGELHEDWPAGAPPFWVAADRLDSPGVAPDEIKSELYNLDAAPYESVMLGLFSVWHSSGKGVDQPKINDIMLGFSRDGFHWDRPFREAVIPVSNDPRTWNYGNVQSVGGGCLVVGDRLFMYASGRNAREDTTGLFFFRRDGFASMEAGEREATLTTRPVMFSGRHLFVNLAAPRGALRVEALDRNGKIIAPFTKDDCVALSDDKTRLKVSWKKGDDLSRLAGQPVRFRFHLTRGALYAFWVSSDGSGASQGYIGAGGPGFAGAIDTVGNAFIQASAR